MALHSLTRTMFTADEDAEASLVALGATEAQVREARFGFVGEYNRARRMLSVSLYTHFLAL